MNNKNIYFITDNRNEAFNRCADSIELLGSNVQIINVQTMSANPFNLTARPSGFVVLDYPSIPQSVDGLPENFELYVRHHRVLLANLADGDLDEVAAIQRGCVGAIYGDISEIKLTEAMSGVMRNELWFSRRSISIALSSVMNASSNHSENNGENFESEEQTKVIDALTRREKTIVGLVCQGASNQDIANSLYISCHTVKTHIYSAFKKTNSKNRVELTCWAMKYAGLTEMAS